MNEPQPLTKDKLVKCCKEIPLGIVYGDNVRSAVEGLREEQCSCGDRDQTESRCPSCIEIDKWFPAFSQYSHSPGAEVATPVTAAGNPLTGLKQEPLESPKVGDSRKDGNPYSCRNCPSQRMFTVLDTPWFMYCKQCGHRRDASPGEMFAHAMQKAPVVFDDSLSQPQNIGQGSGLITPQCGDSTGELGTANSPARNVQLKTVESVAPETAPECFWCTVENTLKRTDNSRIDHTCQQKKSAPACDGWCDWCLNVGFVLTGPKGTPEKCPCTCHNKEEQ